MKPTFAAVYGSGVLAEILIRAPHERQRCQTTVVVDHVDGVERTLVRLLVGGLIVAPAVYAWTPWLDRTNYHWSTNVQRRAGALGSVLLAVAVWIFGRAHRDLGQNWSPSLQLRQEHELVTRGIYRRIRHPMYASQWVWSAAQALLFPNWIAGWASFVLFVPLYVLRVPREERMMQAQFGAVYQQYMQQTGRVLPRLWNRNSK